MSTKKDVAAADRTRFVASAPKWQILPETGLPEFAFAGRSNVGKSSLLSMLLKKDKLVRTSSTPGRTQGLNLFVWDDRLAFVDLPGYGYAKLPQTMRDAIARMTQDYLRERAVLRGVVVLVDARRDEVSELDRAMVAWVTDVGRPLLLAITKIDQVPKNRRKNVARSIEAALGVPQNCAVLCSVKEGLGAKELFAAFAELSR